MTPAEMAERERLVAEMEEAHESLRFWAAVNPDYALAREGYTRCDKAVHRTERALAAFDAAHKGEG